MIVNIQKTKKIDIKIGVVFYFKEPINSICILKDFSYCMVDSSVKLIPDEAFQNVNNLEQITIPPFVTSIGNYAFHRCNFSQITIPSSVKIIGESAFKCSFALEQVIIPSSVTSIGKRAFYLNYVYECQNEFNDPQMYLKSQFFANQKIILSESNNSNLIYIFQIKELIGNHFY